MAEIIQFSGRAAAPKIAACQASKEADVVVRFTIGAKQGGDYAQNYEVIFRDGKPWRVHCVNVRSQRRSHAKNYVPPKYSKKVIIAAARKEREKLHAGRKFWEWVRQQWKAGQVPFEVMEAIYFLTAG